MVRFWHMPIVEPDPAEGHNQQRFFAGLGVAPATPGRRLRIVVIDDDRDTADSLTLVLGLLGHESHAAYSGQSGMEMTQALTPDVVICDLAMPGMDGYSLVEALREEQAGTTFIAASGYGSAADRARAHAAGFHLHLLKPLDLERLRDILAECARRRSLRDR